MYEKLTRKDLIKMVEDFQYYPNLDKNIIPFESDIRDIFNLCVSQSIRRFGLKSHMYFSFYERTDQRFEYWVSSSSEPAEKYINSKVLPSKIYVLDETGERTIEGRSGIAYYTKKIVVAENVLKSFCFDTEKPYMSITRIARFQTSMLKHIPKHLLRL